MNKLLITMVLVLAFSLSALAAGGKFKTKQRYVTPAPEQQLKSYKHEESPTERRSIPTGPPATTRAWSAAEVETEGTPDPIAG